MVKRAAMKSKSPAYSKLGHRVTTSRQSCLASALAGLGALLLAANASSAPLLQIAGSNQTVTVSWPATAYHYVLQTAATIAPQASSDWTNTFVATSAIADLPIPTSQPGAPQLTTNFANDRFFITQPATNDLTLYRLEAAAGIPVTRFAVFFDGVAEFTYCPPLTFRGAVHANGQIIGGSTGNYTFGQTVTSTENYAVVANDGHDANWAYSGTLAGTPPIITNVPRLVVTLQTANTHSLIEIPNPTLPIPPRAANQTYPLFYLAPVILLVSNTSVTLKLQSPPSPNHLPAADPTPFIRTFSDLAYIAAPTNLPFLQLTNTFYDQRELKTNLVADVNIGLYRLWLATNEMVLSKGILPSILFIANCRTHSSQQLPVVRLANGRALPENHGLGFTVATPNPLYVWGHFNQTNNAYLGTTNTLSGSVPAALISDALTILSPNWIDTNSLGFYRFDPSHRRAADTTVNAAIIAGNMPSSGNSWSTFSGGVPNFPRLLEDWFGSGGPKTLTLNTAFVRLFTSTMATNQFRNPVNFVGSGQTSNPYFDPPVRQFNYDGSFLNPTKQPPGVPLVSIVSQAAP